METKTDRTNDTWHKIKVDTNPNVSEWFQFTHNRKVPIEWRGKRVALPYWFGTHIDFDNNRYTMSDKVGAGYPDLNELVADGMIVRVNAYREYDVFKGKDFELTETSLEEILAEFKENGFNVTEEAVRHQYNAWRCDYKSGYRDEENGYHLFTPCGCNPFSLRVSSLANTPDIDWQTTYEW